MENNQVLNFEIFLKEPTTITWWNIVVEASHVSPSNMKDIFSEILAEFIKSYELETRNFMKILLKQVLFAD